MAPKKRTAGPGPTVVDSTEDKSLITKTEELPISEEWLPQILDTQRGFFDAVAAVPEGGWEKLLIYLYRMDPPVSNKMGDAKYIDVYSVPITEASVKTKHGGGKFWALLKMGEHTLRNHRFWIEGDPIFQPGQTVRGGPMAGAPLTGTTILPSGQQDIGAIVRQVIEATGGNSKAADAGIEVMKRAFTDGLDLQKSISTRQLDSTTGSSLGDKLFESLLPRMLAPPTPDPMVMKLFDAFVADRKADRREPNPAPAVPAGPDLALIKELLGVDSLREVIDRRMSEQPWWVSIVSTAVEKLPTILNEFAQMQERGFQRAVIAHQLGAAPTLPPAPGRPVPATPVIPLQPSPIVAQPAPPVGTMSEQMIQGIVEGICRAYDEGYPGDMAAAHLKLLYPQLVDSLRPLLSDPQQLSNFVTQTPALAERAREEDWPGFQQEFLEEVRQVPSQDIPGANEARIAADAIQAIGAAPPRKPPTRKKGNEAVA
jgi:hypothetical protein